jgi:poly-gamma-glutamate synthesis protein (capsule biosynthesis protein)
MAGKTYTFRAATANTAWYKALGVDIVSLANNHAFDFGEAAFLDTLDTLENYGIAQIGGGRNLEEAQKIQYYIVN